MDPEYLCQAVSRWQAYTELEVASTGAKIGYSNDSYSQVEHAAQCKGVRTANRHGSALCYAISHIECPKIAVYMSS